MLSSTSPITRPRPPSQTRRPSNMPSPARMRTQSHTPARRPMSPDAPPPYSEEKPERHSLTEIDDMLNVAGSVVRNRERELDAAALASRSLLEENKLMFAKREALLARLPISPRTSLSHPAERVPTNRSSSWSTCSDDSDMDTGTPRRDVATPTPDALEAHRIFTPTHSANNSVDLAPAARLVPTQAERIAALHAGLSSPPPARPPSTTRRVSVSPAAVNHLQDANSALLARVQELEEATAKAQSEGAAKMRRLQAEAESLRARLGEAEKANEGLRTEAEREKEKRVRARSAGHRKPAAEPAPPMPEDFAPGATWRPEFRSLRGGVRPVVEPSRAATVRSPARAVSTIAPVTPGRTSVRPVRAQSNAAPPRQPVSPKHTPVKPSMLRHQRANSYAGLGKVPSLQAALDTRMVSTVVEEGTDAEASPKIASLGLAGSPRIPSLGLATSPKLSTLGINASPRAVTSPMGSSPTQLSPGVLPFPSLAGGDEVDMSPMSTRLLAQQLVAKINELQATNEEIQQQRDSLKDMLEHAQSEADDLKRVCERLEHEVEVERSASGSGGERSGGEEEKRRPGLQLEIPDNLDEPGWTGSVRGRKKGGALRELAAELGAELPDDGNATDVDANRPLVDLASELAASMGPDSKPSTPTNSNFGSLGVGHPNPRARQVSNTSKPGSAKRALGNRGMATRAKTNPRRIRKSLSSVVFGKSLPSPVSSPTTVQGDSTPYQESPVTPARGADGGFSTPARSDEARSEYVTPRSEFPPREFVTPQPEVYLTPASTLRIPGGLSAISPMTEGPESAFPKEDSTMAQLRAALDPLFDGVVKGKDLFNGQEPPSIVEPKAIQRKRSNLRLVFSKDEPLEPWEVQIKDLYTRIQAMEDDPGMSSAGEDAFRGSRRARALGRMSMRRRHKADDGVSDYAADDSEVGGEVARREEEKRGFELARKLQQKSMSTFLEALLFVQFAVVLVVFVYTAVRRGPKAVLGTKRR